jgi:glutathione S-transferase
MPYYHPLSGQSHRAHLLLSLLGAEFKLVAVDLISTALKSREYLAIKRFGQVPTLVDGDITIADSNAILVSLAMKRGHADSRPHLPEGAAAVQRWLSGAAGEIACGPAAVCLITVFGAKRNADDVISRAHAMLNQIDEQSHENEWLTQGHMTLADIAPYSYIARAPDGNVDLGSYPNVLHGCARPRRGPVLSISARRRRASPRNQS